MNPIRVGVWGVGAWGEKHARVYAALDGATLVSLHGRDAELAHAVAEQYACRVFADPDTMLHAVGLERRGFWALLASYKLLIREGLTVEDAEEWMRATLGAVPEVEHLARPAETSARGLTR